MKITVNESMFRDQFRYYGRADQFSYNALTALYNYLEDAYPEPEGYDLDVIGLCCEFSEHATALDAVKGYSAFELDTDLSEHEQEQVALEFLNDNTTVIPFDGGILIAEF
jgi:hypothetical protein